MPTGTSALPARRRGAMELNGVETHGAQSPASQLRQGTALLTMAKPG